MNVTKQWKVPPLKSWPSSFAQVNMILLIGGPVEKLCSNQYDGNILIMLIGPLSSKAKHHELKTETPCFKTLIPP